MVLFNAFSVSVKQKPLKNNPHTGYYNLNFGYGDFVSLLSTLKSNQGLRRLFGKRELIIIEKQLLGVALTQSEKNRLSRDIRQKLKAVSALGRFESEFELKKGSEIRRWVEEAKEIILKSRFGSRIKRIALFGSAIENKLSFHSDIDIAVEFEKISPDEAARFQKELLGLVNQRIDLQVLNVLPEKIIQEANSKGRVLFERADTSRQSLKAKLFNV